MRMRIRYGMILLLAFIIVLTGWGLPREYSREVTVKPGEIRLIAAGDIIMHLPIVHSARKGSGEYDFRSIFSLMAPILQKGDITVASLETVLSGSKGGYTGYPRFNSPDELVDALVWAGVDLVFTAHNHSLDRGGYGALRTQEVLSRAGLSYVGTNKNSHPESRICVLNINGARLAFLSYTLMTNGVPSPAGMDWLVHRFQKDRVRQDVSLAKRKGAQFIICALHAGTEYRLSPDAAQKDAVDFLVRSGVDLVLGSHPHVVQPLEWRQRNGLEAPSLAAYSLGNFISNQQWRYSDCGLVLDITLTPLTNGGFAVERFCPIPIWVHRYRVGRRMAYRIVPVPPGGEVGDDPLYRSEDRSRLRQVATDMQGVLNTMPLSLREMAFYRLP